MFKWYERSAVRMPSAYACVESENVVAAATNVMAAPAPVCCESGIPLMIPLRRDRHAGSFLDQVEALADRASADGPDHFELDEPVQLDGVLHRKLLRDRLDEAVHDHGSRLLLRQ